MKRHQIAVLVAALSLGTYGYDYRADFSVYDDVEESYGIDIERNSHYSHGHGKVVDGQYAILLNGNRHYLATPKSRRGRSPSDGTSPCPSSGRSGSRKCSFRFRRTIPSPSAIGTRLRIRGVLRRRAHASRSSRKAVRFFMTGLRLSAVQLT